MFRGVVVLVGGVRVLCLDISGSVGELYEVVGISWVGLFVGTVRGGGFAGVCGVGFDDHGSNVAVYCGGVLGGLEKMIKEMLVRLLDGAKDRADYDKAVARTARQIAQHIGARGIIVYNISGQGPAYLVAVPPNDIEL